MVIKVKGTAVPAGPVTLVNCAWILSEVHLTFDELAPVEVQAIAIFYSLGYSQVCWTEISSSNLLRGHLGPAQQDCANPDLLPAKGNGRVPCKHPPLLTVPIVSGRELPRRCTKENGLALQHQLHTLTLPSHSSG